jgi:IS605 OrfB family transposase
MADVNHCVSKRIIQGFQGSRIILEDLKGIRKIKHGKRINRMLGNWSYFQLQGFIEYKANRDGIVVEKVNPMYTSQLCHRCGSLGVRVRGSFSCHCGLVNYSADLNAARNLSLPMLVKRQAAVKQPNVEDDDSMNQRSPSTSPPTLVVDI